MYHYHTKCGFEIYCECSYNNKYDIMTTSQPSGYFSFVWKYRLYSKSWKNYFITNWADDKLRLCFVLWKNLRYHVSIYTLPLKLVIYACTVDIFSVLQTISLQYLYWKICIATRCQWAHSVLVEEAVPWSGTRTVSCLIKSKRTTSRASAVRRNAPHQL